MGNPSQIDTLILFFNCLNNDKLNTSHSREAHKAIMSVDDLFLAAGRLPSVETSGVAALMNLLPS